jgi:hypothetical protein
VRVGPPHGDPDEHPRRNDHERPEENAEAEAGHDEPRQQRLRIRDQENEAEIQHHHRDCQCNGDAPPGVVERLELLGVIHVVQADLKVGTTTGNVLRRATSALSKPT